MPYRVGKCQLGRLLRSRNMTQQALAEITGYTKSRISEYVTGRTEMSAASMYTVAQVVNCEMSELYEWIEIGRSGRQRNGR